MARKDRRLRLRLRPPCGEDRLSALPDELLHIILRRVDTRTALGTAALSKRWAAIPRELPALDLRVTDALPTRYHRCLHLRRDALAFAARRAGSRLTAITGRYERRAMRAMARSVKALLASRAHRRVSRLSIEVFAYNTSACINRLVETAVDSWGVKDLEVVATLTGPHSPSPPVYSFPHGRISGEPGASRLQSLKLSNCLPPPLQGFNTLTTIVLQRLPRSTPAAVYTDVVAACPQLQVLRLISCWCEGAQTLLIDAPTSEIRELVVDGCFLGVILCSLPKLESLTIVRNYALQLRPGATPCLARVSLAFSIGPLQGDEGLVFLNRGTVRILLCTIREIFEAADGITDLVLRLTGPEMWIMPKSPFAPMPNLRRLLVADVPSSWDASWPRLLVEAAPLLESLYVHHVSRCSKENKPAGHETEIPWQPSNLPHRHLKELVVVGFQITERRQVGLVRFAIEASTALRHVSLYKHGHVLEHREGRWHWEVVSQQCVWSDEEKHSVLEQITEGRNCCSTGRVEVVLG